MLWRRLKLMFALNTEIFVIASIAVVFNGSDQFIRA